MISDVDTHRQKGDSYWFGMYPLGFESASSRGFLNSELEVEGWYRWPQKNRIFRWLLGKYGCRHSLSPGYQSLLDPPAMDNPIIIYPAKTTMDLQHYFKMMVKVSKFGIPFSTVYFQVPCQSLGGCSLPLLQNGMLDQSSLHQKKGWNTPRQLFVCEDLTALFAWTLDSTGTQECQRQWDAAWTWGWLRGWVSMCLSSWFLIYSYSQPTFVNHSQDPKRGERS